VDEAARQRLAAWLTAQAGAPVVLGAMSLMPGGAIQQNWSVNATVGGEAQRWVLRTDAPAVLGGISRPRAEEFRLLKAAHEAGVAVPEPLYLCTDTAVTGQPFFVMRRLSGIAAGRMVVRSETLGGGRVALVEALGRELARIHRIRPPRPDLDFLGEPDRGSPLLRAVAGMRARLDRARLPRPVLEWGLRHLERNAAPATDVVLCHNDFRSGNIMLDDHGVTGVLDWEFAAWGDPHEDIGWLCARCWRFGGPGEVGGIGPRAPFLAAYEGESGRRIDPVQVRLWELAGAIRWAVIAIAQAERHISGTEPSLELALTGHIVPELELDVIRHCIEDGR
jgi:aminoglycoside phosphotransferase (APT) family kinase protein